MPGARKTLVLIHGLWLTPKSWEHFQRFFEGLGYDVIAPAWPGMKGDVEALRADPSALRGLGLDEIAWHYQVLVRELPEAPVLVGHSFGGLIVQMLLDHGCGTAGVALCSAPPRGVFGVPLTALRAASPVLTHPASYWGTVMLTYEQFRYGFANAMHENEARRAYEQYAIPGPGRPIFQAAFANLNPFTPAAVEFGNHSRPPLLFVAASEDHQVPASVNLENYRRYREAKALTEYREFPGRSHLIMVQSGWQEVAGFVHDWIQGRSSSGVREDTPAANTPDTSDVA